MGGGYLPLDWWKEKIVGFLKKLNLICVKVQNPGGISKCSSYLLGSLLRKKWEILGCQTIPKAAKNIHEGQTLKFNLHLGSK